MARAEPLPPFSGSPMLPASFPYDPYLDLGRLLARLEQKLLRIDRSRWRRLVADEFQRLQARFDVAAARKLLARVEQGGAAASAKMHGRRPDWQAELQRRRALIEQLQERLDNLDEEARAAAAMDTAGDEDDEVEDGAGAGAGDDADEDDVLAHVTQTRHASGGAAAADMAADMADTADAARAAAGQTTQDETRMGGRESDGASLFSMTESAAMMSSGEPARPRRRRTNRVRIASPTSATPAAGLRSRTRRGSSRARDDTARTTSSEVEKSGDGDGAGAAMTSLFRRGDGGDGGDGVATEEIVLDHHRREQEALSEDILRLAQALKDRSVTTARLLEDDRDVVDRVGEGMNTTTDSLSAASRSMAVLTRMTEGKGWWGRMLLLGMVYGLMAVLVLLFFFLPKLRL